MLLEKGTRIIKVNSEPGDGHPDGSKGKILEAVEIPASVAKTLIKKIKKRVPKGHTVEGVYMVEFDDMPGVAVGTMDFKIKQS